MDGAQADGPARLVPAGTDTSGTDTPGTGPSRIDAEVARLGQELGRQMRLLHLLKVQLTGLMPPGLEWAAFGVLSQLTRCGAKRQSDLAELSLLDPSTVSRHVGQLVRQRLVERRPDPEDGRAVQLVATDRGQAVVAETTSRRNTVFLSALQGWDAADLRALTKLLSRFNDDLETFRRGASRAGPPPGPPSRQPSGHRPAPGATDPREHA
jgi:DNA-binding MarR family transcriptional regulator